VFNWGKGGNCPRRKNFGLSGDICCGKNSERVGGEGVINYVSSGGVSP